MRRPRRKTLTPGEHDARALAVANRRIVELETAHAAAVRQLNRTVDRHQHGCTHAQQLAEVTWQRDGLARRLRTTLDQLRAINGSPTEPIKAIDAGSAE